MVARRFALVALVAASAVVVAPRPAAAHPLHTTMTELSYDPSSRVLQATLRVFADDFTAAVRGARASASDAIVIPPDSAILRYLSARFAVTARGAGRVALQWCGLRREGVVLFLCLRGTVQGSLTGASVSNALLAEIFPDQVNIVQASYEGRRRTLLFTPRDGARSLP